jgi:hypothetical protein
MNAVAVSIPHVVRNLMPTCYNLLSEVFSVPDMTATKFGCYNGESWAFVGHNSRVGRDETFYLACLEWFRYYGRIEGLV